MNIGYFFDSDEMRLPKSRPKGDFEDYLSLIFDSYNEIVGQLDSSCHLCRRIKEQSGSIKGLEDAICGSIDDYLKGQPERAYTQLQKDMGSVKNRLDDLKTLPIASEDIGNMYRMRVSRDGKPFEEPKDLFHIPFELRHKVSSQRYSIPGLPCLYLGSTIELCWHELGNPPFEGVYLSKFRPKKNNIKFLNFAYKPQVLAPFVTRLSSGNEGQKPREENFFISYAICWPLIAASSIECLYPNEPFVPEYIIPQLIMQWFVRDASDYDGIRYFSIIWVPENGIDEFINTINYAFPVKSKDKGGYCAKLKEKFELTKPLAIKGGNFNYACRVLNDKNMKYFSI
jgi:hypothetical protein